MNGLISLVSVYNNDELLNEMIVSLSKQKDIEVERIFLDNKNRPFACFCLRIACFCFFALCLCTKDSQQSFH